MPVAYMLEARGMLGMPRMSAGLGTSDGGLYGKVAGKGWEIVGVGRLNQKQNHVNCNSYCRSKPVSPQKNTSEKVIEACKPGKMELGGVKSQKQVPGVYKSQSNKIGTT